MSNQYFVEQKMSIRNIAAEESESLYYASILQSQLAAINYCLTLDCAYVTSLKITTDDKTTCFQGSYFSEEIVNAIRNITNANTIDVYAVYNFYDRVCSDAEPFFIMNTLDNAEDSIFEDLSFSCHVYYDGESGAGDTYKFGYFNSSLFKGRLEPKYSAELPDGEWKTYEAVVLVEDMPVDSGNGQHIIDLCNKLMTLSSCDRFEIKDNILNYCMDNAILKSPEDIQNFITWSHELKALCNSIENPQKYSCCAFLAEFYEASEERIRKLVIDFDPDEPAVYVTD